MQRRKHTEGKEVTSLSGRGIARLKLGFINLFILHVFMEVLICARHSRAGSPLPSLRCVLAGGETQVRWQEVFLMVRTVGTETHIEVCLWQLRDRKEASKTGTGAKGRLLEDRDRKRNRADLEVFAFFLSFFSFF